MQRVLSDLHVRSRSGHTMQAFKSGSTSSAFVIASEPSKEVSYNWRLDYADVNVT